MKRKPKLIVLSIYLLIFLCLIGYNLAIASLWAIDAMIGIALIILFFFISEKLNIDWVGLFFACLIPFIHNLGTFGFYNQVFWFFGYDKALHFIGSFIGVVIVAKVISEVIFWKNKKGDFKKDLSNVIIAISTIMLIAVIVELIEFFGYTYFHASWQGMFSPNSLPNPSRILDYNYNDTMRDLFSDLLGAIVGVFGYCVFRKKRK